MYPSTAHDSVPGPHLVVELDLSAFDWGHVFLGLTCDSCFCSGPACVHTMYRYCTVPYSYHRTHPRRVTTAESAYLIRCNSHSLVCLPIPTRRRFYAPILHAPCTFGCVFVDRSCSFPQQRAATYQLKAPRVTTLFTVALSRIRFMFPPGHSNILITYLRAPPPSFTTGMLIAVAAAAADTPHQHQPPTFALRDSGEGKPDKTRRDVHFS